MASAGDDGNILIWEWRKNQKFSLTKKIDKVFEDDINKMLGYLEDGISNIFGNKGRIAIPKINDMFSKQPQVKVSEIDDIFPRHRHKRIRLFVTLYAKLTDKMPRQHTSNPKITKVSKAIASPFY
ncbi:hypothetical protein [Microcystis aeruginosa]|uniref:hypothetical protein n=1 Tax=Microcystis TaxID=1125 RepID=UPI00232CE8CE|nr:hypothetical protein [Microcystis aeruginosa]MDB9508963.1 hypothetical protein [Microcystis aeruginosa CS-338/01]